MKPNGMAAKKARVPYYGSSTMAHSLSGISVPHTHLDFIPFSLNLAENKFSEN